MISALMPTYNRTNLAFKKGKGVWLYTEDGKEFLDFGAGIATSAVGHNHSHLIETIIDQAKHVIHVSNLYRIPQAERLAQRFVEISFADSVFFCNSGAEANEGLIKAIRRAQNRNGHPERTSILCFNHAFHGRTLATLSATGNPKYLDGFGSPVPGFDHVELGNIDLVRQAINEKTAGILLEAIQGESGVNVVPDEFLRELRSLCDEKGIYLGFDEVQSGMGRTGKLFAHEWSGVKPDIISVAKGIAGGVPMGAILAKESIAKHLTAGSHGSTFGGNPLACAAGNAVLDIVLKPNFLNNVVEKGHLLFTALQNLVQTYPDVFETVRGRGLILGIKGKLPAAEIQNAALYENLLTVTAGGNVIRIVPPLIVSNEECLEGVRRLAAAAEKLTASLKNSKVKATL